MSIESVETLLTLLRRAQLLTPDQLEEVARELGPHYSDPRDLATCLVDIEWLTVYQAQALFQGAWQHLTIGPYQILARLGEGGVSAVYKAWDTDKGRYAALKVLHPDLVSHTDAVNQFEREHQIITRLSHPNIIAAYDANQVGVRHFFAMEYIEGMDLYQLVQQYGPLPVEQACDYLRQAATGLQHAHQSGLVHRDIKPANLFVIHAPIPGPAGGPVRRGPTPVVKILDWGLARLRPEMEGMPELDEHDLDAEKAALIGTADYVAPEQARDPTLVDIRGDIYSLGCTLYYLLTGKPPFPAPSLMQKLLQHQEALPPSVASVRPDVPVELDLAIQKMLAKQPDERYQIPLLVVAALRRFCPGAGSNGSVIRPATPSTGILARPNSTLLLNGDRPSSSANLPGSRPSSAANLARPGSNGQPR
jgi:serine/threonine-protein kinase